MMSVLARVPLRRVLRTRRAYVSILGFSLLASVGIAASKAVGMTSTGDHLMRGGFGVFVVPLVSYAVVGSALGGDGLRRALDGVVALGAEPKRAAAATLLVSMVASMAICALLGVFFCLFAHGATDPPLARDLPITFGVAALGGATYGAYFTAGSSFGRSWGRGAFLAADWILGTDPDVLGVVVPRGHLRSLLGGPLVLDASPRVSSVALVFLLLAYAGLAVVRIKDARRA